MDRREVEGLVDESRAAQGEPRRIEDRAVPAQIASALADLVSASRAGL